MAVPEFLRKARTMRVYGKAKSILIHTRQILASEKNIPKRHRHDYGDRLDNEATEMYLCVCRANTIHPTRQEDYLLRREYLILAKTHAETLCYFLDLAYDAGFLRNISMDFWYGEIDEFLTQLAGLRKSDRERFGKLLVASGNA